MYSYLFTEAELEPRLLECQRRLHMYSANVQTRFIDVYSCKAPAGEGQHSLSQKDDKHKDGARGGGFWRQLVRELLSLS